MKKFLFIFLLFIGFSSLAQQTHFIIKGKVIDSTTQLPLAGASVFCQNTTFGTITNADGEFAMKLPAGGYDLIVSYTSYESEQFRISNGQTEDLSIALKPKDMSLTEVVVSGSTEVADGFQKYGKFFFDNFIGTTANATQCTIQNPDALQFFYSKKRNRLKVKSKEDLVINNQALGYKIRYQLDSFTYEYATEIGTFSGFPFFEEMQGTEEQQAAWKEHRLKAYNGSRLHFIRSWYDSTLAEEGFVIEKVDTSKTRLTTEPVPNPYDSSYYSITADGDVEINMPGKLYIIYRNEMPDSAYLKANDLPLYLRSQISIIDVAAPFVIEENGYFYEQSDMVNTGYWTWEKMAEQLPYDYDPE
jgi:hypothetical protein